MYKSTTRWSKYWAERKMDWNEGYLKTFDHPHRRLVIDFLKGKQFRNVMEVGCASGPNLLNVKNHFPNAQVGGCDVSRDAILTAKKALPTGIFDVCSVENLFFTDKCVDICLSDMTLIYLDPSRIRKALKEIRRVTLKHCLFFEFHHENFLHRLGLRLTAGYHSYNYKKLLKEAGFSEIRMHKLTEDEWPGGQPQKTFGYFITATP